MKEYGSNIEKLAAYLLTITDRAKRTLQAHVLVELMRQIHPNMRDGQDYSQKLWDDLYILTNFKLDVDSPFPPPSPESVGKKPLTVPYNQHEVRYRQYGHNVRALADKAMAVTDREEKLAFVSYIIRLMRTFYSTWNRENPEDEVVFGQLGEISKGGLREELAHLRQNGLVDSVPRDKGTNVDRFQRNQQQRDRNYTPNNTGRDNNGNTRDGNRDNTNRDRNYRPQFSNNRDGNRDNTGNAGNTRDGNRDNNGNNRNNRDNVNPRGNPNGTGPNRDRFQNNKNNRKR